MDPQRQRELANERDAARYRAIRAALLSGGPEWQKLAALLNIAPDTPAGVDDSVDAALGVPGRDGGRAMTDPQLPPLPLPKPGRHRLSCEVFDPTPGPCDCGSPPKIYDRLEMESYAARAVYADRAAAWTSVLIPNPQTARKEQT
jgi:hypothetical protein